MNEETILPITPTLHELDPSWKGQWRRMKRLRWADVKGLVGTAINAWFDQNIPRLGASLAFYTLLSLAPLLIMIVVVAGSVYGDEAARGQLEWQIQGFMGREAAIAVQAVLRGTQRPGAGFIATVLSGITLLLGSSAVVSELRAALNTIWCVKQKKTSGLQSILEVVKDRFTAFLVVLAVGFFLLLSLAANASIAAVVDHLYVLAPLVQWSLHALDFVISYLVITGLFAFLFKYLPDLRVEWADVLVGASLTAFLFSGGRLLLAIYLSQAGFGSTYGAAGSLVVFLVWVYYSAQIFFLGAALTQAYAQQFGSRPCDPKNEPLIKP